MPRISVARSRRSAYNLLVPTGDQTIRLLLHGSLTGRLGAMAGRMDKTRTQTGAELGFEAKLWAAADALRNNMDAAEYKHVVLGLIFLKYISDAFEAKHAELDAQQAEGANPEDPDEYRAVNIFWVPKEARWSHDRRRVYGAPLAGNAKFALMEEFIR